jgi:hypothetical protein
MTDEMTGTQRSLTLFLNLWCKDFMIGGVSWSATWLDVATTLASSGRIDPSRETRIIENGSSDVMVVRVN